jgi:hypothetical protein
MRFARSEKPFAERIKYHIAWPTLNCDDCWQQYEAHERRTFPCDKCPEERFGPIVEADRATQLYFRLVYYLNASPESMGGHPWELLCAMAGITDLEMLREVWERMGIVKRIHHEHERKQDAKRNGR